MKEQIKIGWGMRTIIPPRPCLIGGQMYTRISMGVQDPITVTALTIDNGEDMVIFATFDAVVCRGGLLDRVRDRLSARYPNMDVSKLVISATHSHTTPETLVEEDIEALIPDEAGDIMGAKETSELVVDRIVEAISESYERRAAGGFAYGYGFATVAHSRRVIYSRDMGIGGSHDSLHSVNGYCQMYGNTNDADFLGYEAGTESFLNAVFTYGVDGKMTGIIVNVPCPAQCSEAKNVLSADYWNEVRIAVKEKFGDVYVLPQCAAAGDLSPRLLHYNEAEKRRYKLKYGADTELDMGRRRDIAERIVSGLAEIEVWAAKDIKTQAVLRHSVVNLQLQRRFISEKQYEESLKGLEEAKQKIPKQNGEWYNDFKKKSLKIREIKRYKNIIESYKQQQGSKCEPMECHVIRLGDMAFATNRFELFMDYEQRIQARSPAEQTFIVQLAAVPGNSGGGYLPTHKGQENKGYSASIFDCIVDADGGQTLVEQTLEELNKLFSE